MSKFKAGLMGAMALGLGLLAANSASATLVTVDGVSLDVSNNGSTNTITNFDHDALITGVGSTLQGVGLVTQIQNSISGPSYIQPCAPVGCAGTFISAHFGGFTVRDIVPNGSSNDVYLTGGFLNYYVLAHRPNQNTGNVATDIANSQSATLFLSLLPDVIDAAGDTFHINIPGTLATFTGHAQGDALLHVTGGDAAAAFDTNGVFNSFLNDFTDFNFIGNAVRLTRSATDLRCPPGPPSTASGHQDFCVQGSDDFVNQRETTVPEPGTLWLLGAGLLGLAGVGRRMRARS